MAAMKRASAKLWAERVAAWRASGLTSEEFSRGREFTAGGLRHWAYRLGKTTKRGQIRTAAAKADARRRQPLKPERVRLARVVREASPEGTRSTAPTGGAPAPTATAPAVTVELGRFRIAVAAGCDRETLATVLSVLDRGGTR
jgi:hypothetical protein